MESKSNYCSWQVVWQKEKVTRYLSFVLLLCIFLPAKFLHAQTDQKKEEENLNVFQQWIKWNNAGSSVLYHLNKQAEAYYKIRDNEIAKLKTKDDWIKRQQLVKTKLMELIGSFPKKEALNSEIVSVTQKEGYRIEKIVYQSVPGFYETGCLYIPDKLNGKAPAILNVFWP